MDLPRITVQTDDGEAMDDYTAAIELSNACREFYVNRLKVVQDRKKRLTSPVGNDVQSCAGDGQTKAGHRRTTVDDAMEKLRHEMASLIDQDLELMKQLLTLNDQIEEIKWRRRYGGQSPDVSSCTLDYSACAVGEADPGKENDHLVTKYPSPSSLSLCKSTPNASQDLLDEHMTSPNPNYPCSSHSASRAASEKLTSTPKVAGLKNSVGNSRGMTLDLSDRNGAESPNLMEQQSLDSGFNEEEVAFPEFRTIAQNLGLAEDHTITISRKITPL